LTTDALPGPVTHARTTTRSRWPIGLGVAVAGLVVALFAYTGDRTYYLAWFYLAVLAFALVIAGIGYVGYDRAIRPELERRKARGLPAPAPFRERARALMAEAPSPPTRDASTETAGRHGRVERVRMSCPSCAHVFSAEGVRPILVSCPRCGLEGDLP